jgi:phosphoenolpyruvate-protein kinase (PTS system EI component)
MYPYVTSAEEVMQANSLFGEVKWSMLSEVGSTNIPQGIMVETVKAVEQIDRLVDHAEFISIGTNDLTCDLYGIDRYERANPSIDDDYAKLFMTIRNVVRTAHKAGLKVSICGELAARRDYASRFLDTGADCISIAPSKVLLMRDHIINCCW